MTPVTGLFGWSIFSPSHSDSFLISEAQTWTLTWVLRSLSIISPSSFRQQQEQLDFWRGLTSCWCGPGWGSSQPSPTVSQSEKNPRKTISPSKWMVERSCDQRTNLCEALEGFVQWTSLTSTWLPRFNAQLSDGPNKIDHSPLPGKFKVWHY